jgi:hypothetical protein
MNSKNFGNHSYEIDGKLQEKFKEIVVEDYKSFEESLQERYIPYVVNNSSIHGV